MARYSTEAEYKALANTTEEVVWISQLLKDLHIPLSCTPIIWCDTVSATSLASNPVFHAPTKHVEVDFHFVRDKVLHKQLLIQYVLSAYRTADVLTKPLTISHFQFLKSKLRLSVLPASVCGGVSSTMELARAPTKPVGSVSSEPSLAPTKSAQASS